MKHTFTITVDTGEQDRDLILQVLKDMISIAEHDAAETMEDVEEDPDFYDADLVCQAEFSVE